MRRRSVELTRRGWSLVGAAVGLLLAARLLGVDELLVVGVAALALAGGAALWVRAQTPRLRLDRLVRPARVHVGGDGRVDLVVTNRGDRATPLLTVDDRFGDGRRAARFVLPPLEPRTEARAAYRIPVSRRGRYALGPAVVSVTDPFGVAKQSVTIGTVDQTTVYPRVHDIVAPPLAGGHRRAAADATRSRSVAPDGDEFVSLREYEVGDDLRRVHWPATSRTGELFIRQEAARREPHALVVLDVRPDAHDETSFELAVEVVASVAARLTRDGRRVEVRTIGGTLLCRADDAGLLMDRLSVIEPGSSGRPGALAAEIGALETRAREALIVVVTGAPQPREHDALVGRAPRGYPVVLVTTSRAALARGSRPGVRHVDAGREPFVTAWDRAMLGSSHGTRVVAR